MNVQAGVGCFSTLWRADDVTQEMSKGVLVNVLKAGVMTSHGQCLRGGGVFVNVFTPPPSGNPVSAPV